MTTHQLAELLLAGPDLPVVYRDKFFGYLLINTIRSNFDDKDKLIPWWDNNGDIHQDEQAIRLSSEVNSEA